MSDSNEAKDEAAPSVAHVCLLTFREDAAMVFSKKSPVDRWRTLWIISDAAAHDERRTHSAAQCCTVVVKAVCCRAHRSVVADHSGNVLTALAL